MGPPHSKTAKNFFLASFADSVAMHIKPTAFADNCVMAVGSGSFIY